MKIDIHAHTKQIKSGDPTTRNVACVKFDKIIRNTDVKILAITNHNHFDLDQFNEFKNRVGNACQIWPGIELDILENKKNAHLIVLVNPKNVENFSVEVKKLLNGENESSFTTSIDEIVKKFDILDAIYVAHYYTKKPDLSDNQIEQLTNLVSNKNRVMKEATNAISVGIYISHGHKSIHGSDVKDWGDYVKNSKNLPDLRFPVESFEQFCLLLEKDKPTIDTILNKKSKEEITVSPFDGSSDSVTFDIYKDINIFFGSKGTGKTKILEALSTHYNKNGYHTSLYKSDSSHLNLVYDLKGSKMDISLEDYDIEECIDEIDFIKNATEKDITSIFNYSTYYSTERTNKIARGLKITELTKVDESSEERDFEDIREVHKTVVNFVEFTKTNSKLQNIIGSQLLKRLDNVLTTILARLRSESERKFFDFKSSSMLNSLIEVFAKEVAKKTGGVEKPVETGFHDYASNRITIKRNAQKIVDNLSKNIDSNQKDVGDLGAKGDLYCKTNLKIQDGNFINAKFKPIGGANKTPQKEVAKKFQDILKNVYSHKLFEKIAALNSIDGSETITSLGSLLLFYKHFILSGKEYEPSNGESSMILLYNELKEEKDIYLIDEPEKSLGSDYISKVIVPILKEYAQRGRRVIIATHDANIAVRTLPYNSIYREHDIDCYNTYQGNPFTNNLICAKKGKENLDWKSISMKTLEGGREAFGERVKIYGNT